MRPSPMAARAASWCSSSAAVAFFHLRPLVRRAVRPAPAGHFSLSVGCRGRLVDSVLVELRSRRLARVTARIGLHGTKELSDSRVDMRTLRKGLLLEFHKDSERSLLAVVERPDGKKNWIVTDQDPTVLECAWMELSEKDKSGTIVYGSKESLESYCAHFLLSRYIVYFVKVESRDSSVYQTRPSGQVDELLQWKLAKEAAEKELEEFFHLLKSAKALPLDSKPEGRKYKALILKFIKDCVAVLLLVEVRIQATTVVAAGKMGDEVIVVVEMAHPRDDILLVMEIIEDTEE